MAFHYTHMLFDWIFTLGSLFLSLYGIWAGWRVSLLGILSFIFYPFLLETWMWIWAKLTFSQSSERQSFQDKILKMADYSGLIYDPRYNMTLCGLEKMHPFDAVKYQR